MTTSAPLAPMPAGHWLLGHLPQRSKAPLDLFSNTRRELGDVVRYRMGYLYVTQLTHPDHVKHVLVDARDTYPKGAIFDKTRPLVGNGLLNSEGEVWKHQRRLAQPAFHAAQLERLSATMTDTVEQVLPSWEEAARREVAVPVFAELRRLTLRVVVRCLFGLDVDRHTATITDAFTEALLVTNNRIVSPTPYFPPLYRIPSRQNRTFRRSVATLDGLVDELIATRLADADPGGGDDLLALLLAELGPVDAAGSAQLRDELMTLLLAGSETTASALAWTFWLLDSHPDVAASLEGEVGEVLGGRTPTVADLPRLGTVRRVFEETLRLFPPVWAIPRVAREADEIDGYRVPKGEMVILVPYVTHRHPDFWSDPERFDPARFLPENRASQTRWSYLPFGAGSRICLGNTFAMMEATLVLATVVQRLRFRSEAGVTVSADAHVNLRPHGPMPMRAQLVA